MMALHSSIAELCSRNHYVSFVLFVLIRVQKYCSISSPEVLLNLLVPMVQQKWGECHCLVNFYPLIISPSFRRTCKGVKDFSFLSEIDSSCSSSSKAEIILLPADINRAVSAWEGFQNKRSGAVADCFSHHLAALHQGRTGGLKRQPKSTTYIAGYNYYEIHLGIESMLNLIILVVLVTGIAWSKSIHDVLCLQLE